MLVDYVVSAQNNNEESMMHLIHQFRPLLIHWAYKLHYEDALNDLLLAFIEGVRKMNVSTLRNKDDKTIIKYFAEIVKNASYQYLKSSTQPSVMPLGDLSDIPDQKCQLDADDFELLQLCPENVLTDYERQIIIDIFAKGCTASELAKQFHVTRQNISQIKKNAVRKLKRFLENE